MNAVRARFLTFLIAIVACSLFVCIEPQQAQADDEIFQPKDSSALSGFYATVYNGLVDLDTEIDVSEYKIAENQITYTSSAGVTSTGATGLVASVRTHPLFSTLCVGWSGISFESSNGCINKVNVTYQSTWTSALMESFKSGYADFLSGAPTSGSDFQKAAYVHDWVCAHTSYSMQTAYLPDFALGSIAYGKALCAGYSYAYQFLAQQLGLECNYVAGTTKVEAHAWNKVKIDGQWFLIDATWDRALASSTTFSHTYFMLNDTEFAAAGDGSHSSDTDVYGNDPINSSYYFANKFWEGVSGPLSASLLAQDPKLTKVSDSGSEMGGNSGGDQGAMESPAAYPTEDYSLVYDYDYYIEHNADVKAAFNGDKQKTLQHFVTYGMKEGRQGNTLFNVDYYKSHNSDAAAAYGSDLKKYYEHFIKYGTSEGRPASEEFDLTSYYNANQDLRAAFGTNLKKYYTHYVRYGKSEGRTCTGVAELQSCRTSLDGTDYSAVYDGAYYAAKNPDVKAYATWGNACVNLLDDTKLLRHFVNNGMKEGRVSSEAFDLDSYYNANQDLRIAYGANLKSYYTHYMKYGKNEGRTCTGVDGLQNYRTSIDGLDYSPVYDGAYYRASYSDLDSAYTKEAYGHKLFDDTALLRHFVKYGASEGRVSGESFDLVSYFNANGDLRAAYGFNYKNYYTHYVKYGKNEGRTCTGVTALDAYTTVYNGKDYSGEYDGRYYYSNNADLQKAFSKELNGATLINDYALIRHYVTYGIKEGRLGGSAIAFNAQ